MFALLILFWATSFAPALVGAESQTPAAATGPIVELATVTVTDSRDLPPPEAWRYATLPGFEILSSASDRSTQRLLRDFGLFRLALSYVWPMGGRSDETVALIISGQKSRFDAFVPPGTRADSTLARASVFLKSGTRTVIVLDLESSELSVVPTELDDPASGVDSSRISIDHDKQLYREYTRFLLSKAEPRLPAWFEEGMAQIVMAMKVDRKFIEFGRLEEPNTISAQAAAVSALNALNGGELGDMPPVAGAAVEDRDFNVALQRKALLPLDSFFAVAHDAPEALNPLGNNRWAKQAYAFVHMCLYGDKGRYLEPFNRFLTRSARGEAPTEAMFKECFGMTFKQMQQQLRAYIEVSVYTSKEIRAKGDGLPLPPPLALREATQAEIGRIKGEAFLMGGRPELARREFTAAYARGERDPDLLASLGLMDRTTGQDDSSRKYLEAAVQGQTARPEAYLELAKLRFNDALAKHPTPASLFTPAETAGIVGPLMAGREKTPALPAIYDLLADTWLRSAQPKQEEVTVLLQGATLFPGRLKLIYQAAVISADVGLVGPAHALVQHGIKFAPDAAAKGRFEKLKSTLPPEPRASAPAQKK